MKHLLDYNPINLIDDYIAAINKGWRYTKDSRFYMQPSGMYSLTVFEGGAVDGCLDLTEGLVLLAEYDATQYVKNIQQLVLNKYTMKPSSVLFSITGVKKATFILEGHPQFTVYTKEQLDEMDYEELKVIGRSRDAFNRGRSVMVSNILKYQEELYAQLQ